MAILSELFVDTRDATYIFNQGRCFEQNARYQEAITRFQEYLRAGKHLSQEDKATAEQHIADCQKLLAQQKGPATTTPADSAEPTAAPSAAPKPIAAPPPAAPPAPFVSPVLVVEQATPQSAGRAGTGLRRAGVIMSATGGLALVGGVILNLKANNMAADYDKLNGYTKDKESDRQSYETMSWIGYGVGAACAVTGATLYYLGVRAARKSSVSVAIVPSLASTAALGVVKGAF